MTQQSGPKRGSARPQSSDDQPLADRWMHKLRDRPLVAVLIVIAVVIVGAAQTTDAIGKLWGVLSGKPSIDGLWQYQLQSSVSNATLGGTITLTQSGNVLSGEMDNPDPERPNEKSPVQGSIANATLILRRDTNRNGITQEYRLHREGSSYVGDYSNIGQQPGSHFADSGTFRLSR